MSNHDKAKQFLDDIESLTLEQMAEAMCYKWFRLNVLYCIKDKDGKKVKFKPNAEQEDFYLNRHGRDIILKARQLGFTTMKMIMDLDSCLFTPDFSAGCIAHNLEDAKDIFRNKIKFAYTNITDEQRELLSMMGYELPLPVNDKDNGYVFDNGSSIKVSVSYRGGTLQSLHVSEFGKICKKFPDKATEIVTGAFEAVGVGNAITIESTAEGREGYFFDYCQKAQKLRDSESDLNLLDFKFHFFPWWMREEYRLDSAVWDSALNGYFTQLEEKHDITLDDNQKAWYSAKESQLGEKMKREYPSTPEDAFEAQLKGAYYARQFSKIYKEGRICKSYGNDVPVNTAWDIGVGDSTSIWFYQRVGNEVHLVDFYENSGEGLQHYMRVLKEKNYKYGYHYAPHDIENRSFELEARSRKDIAAEGFEIDGEMYSIYFEVVPRKGIEEGIEEARQMLDNCVFDEEKCSEGIAHLEQYRKEWNEKLGCYRDKPLHDSHSHAADAFRYLAVVEWGKHIYVAGPRAG